MVLSSPTCPLPPIQQKPDDYSQKRKCWQKARSFKNEAVCSATFMYYYISTKMMNIRNKTVIMYKVIVAPHHPSLCSAYQQVCLINSSTHFSFCPIFPILCFYREHCCGQSSVQSFCPYRMDCVQGLLSCPQLSCMFRGRSIWQRTSKSSQPGTCSGGGGGEVLAWGVCGGVGKVLFPQCLKPLLLWTGEARCKEFISKICW